MGEKCYSKYIYIFQGGRSRVSTKEEGVHQVSGEQGRRSGEPKQSSDRRTQVTQRTLHWQTGRLVLLLTTI